jgi:hypothetical protein
MPTYRHNLYAGIINIAGRLVGASIRNVNQLDRVLNQEAVPSIQTLTSTSIRLIKKYPRAGTGT